MYQGQQTRRNVAVVQEVAQLPWNRRVSNNTSASPHHTSRKLLATASAVSGSATADGRSAAVLQSPQTHINFTTPTAAIVRRSPAKALDSAGLLLLVCRRRCRRRYRHFGHLCTRYTIFHSQEGAGQENRGQCLSRELLLHSVLATAASPSSLLPPDNARSAP